MDGNNKVCRDDVNKKIKKFLRKRAAGGIVIFLFIDCVLD